MNTMKRAYLIVLTPALLVAAGYVVLLRRMGLAPGYPRLAAAVLLVLGSTLWLGRRGAAKAGPRGPR